MIIHHAKFKEKGIEVLWKTDINNNVLMKSRKYNLSHNLMYCNFRWLTLKSPFGEC